MSRDKIDVTNSNIINNINNNIVNNNNLNCKNNKKNFGLANYTYADFVILSSVLAYAIGEELNDEDLTLFIVFLTQVSADLSLIRTQRTLQGAQTNQQQEQAIIAAEETEQAVEDISISELNRGKRKKVKKKKIKKKKA